MILDITINSKGPPPCYVVRVTPSSLKGGSNAAAHDASLGRSARRLVQQRHSPRLVCFRGRCPRPWAWSDIAHTSTLWNLLAEATLPLYCALSLLDREWSYDAA